MKLSFLHEPFTFAGFTVMIGLATLFPHHRITTLAQSSSAVAISDLPNTREETAPLAIAPAIAPEQLCKAIPSSRLFARTELFFGLSKQDNSEISEVEFQHFLAQEVTPRFPDGLTLLTGRGQFKNSSGLIIKEPTQLLILLYPFEQFSNNSQEIQEIRNAYKTIFQQESVLRTDEFSCISF
ncbi:MAG: DUF3574 domain-containing protein [Thermosynechococcaceae cyanobacterium]